MDTNQQAVVLKDEQLPGIFNKLQRRSAAVVEKLWLLAAVYFALTHVEIANGAHAPRWAYFPSLFAIIIVLVAQAMYVTVTMLKEALMGSTRRHLAMWLCLAAAMVATANSAIFLPHTS